MPKTIRVRLDLRAAAAFLMKIPKKRAKVVKGTDAVYNIKPQPLTGFTGDIDLQAAGLPTGAVATITPNPVAYNETAQVSIGTADVDPGSYNFDLQAAGGSDYNWLYIDLVMRLIAWSKAGVWYGGVKGIPTYPVDIDLTGLSSYGGSPLDPTGVVDSSTAIQNAINACAAGHAVYLPAGTWKNAIGIALKSGVVLRGAGWSTILVGTQSSGTSGTVMMNGAGYSETGDDLVSGYTAGSISITVTTPSMFAVGNLILIDQLNDPSFVDIASSEGGDCTSCSRLSGTRSLGETHLVTNKLGSVLTLDQPLIYTYNATYSPQASVCASNPILNAGVENLSLTYSGASLDPTGVQMIFASGCWIKDCEIYGIPRMGVNLQGFVNGSEIRDSYIHDSISNLSDHGYAISMTNDSTYTLIENNMVKECHTLCAIGSAGGAGNVIAYNYCYNVRHYQENWFIEATGTHGAHTILNLWEGNITPKISYDEAHGSGSHQMVFRNYIRGDCPGVPITNNLCVLEFEPWQSYISMIGNVIGHPSWAGTYDFVTGTSWCLYKITDSTPSTTLARLIRHGNYDRVNDAVTWEPGISGRNIPDSLYLSAKPSWWDASPWPPFTPEREGFDPDVINKIPAQVRFEAL